MLMADVDAAVKEADAAHDANQTALQAAIIGRRQVISYFVV